MIAQVPERSAKVNEVHPHTQSAELSKLVMHRMLRLSVVGHSDMEL
jgi:hypothetical protein